MLGLKSVQQSQEIFQTHQSSLKNADHPTCTVCICVCVWVCVCVCVGVWVCGCAGGEMGAYLIFLTGLAAMQVRRAQSKHILFISLFLMCQEQSGSPQTLAHSRIPLLLHKRCSNDLPVLS